MSAVTVTGLVSKPELNGLLGEAIEFLPDRQRFRVLLSDGKGDLSVKPSNVVFTEKHETSLFQCRDGSVGAAFRVMTVRGRPWMRLNDSRLNAISATR